MVYRILNVNDLIWVLYVFFVLHKFVSRGVMVVIVTCIYFLHLDHKCTEDTQVHQSKDACSICKKILVDLTPIERLQHVNSCADQVRFLAVYIGDYSNSWP